MNKYFQAILCLLMLGIAATGQAVETQTATSAKKILYVDSYNANAWSATIEQGIMSVMNHHPEITLKTFHMDTKANPSEEFKKAAALRAKEVIKSWKPDLVITSDDNAAKYLISEHYLNSDIPFVFCGVNNDAAVYGFPTKNITGILEIPLFSETFNIIKDFAKGEKIAFIGCDNLTTHTTYNYFTEVEKIDFDLTLFVKDAAELKAAILQAQQSTDMIYLYDTYSVANFDYQDMREFALKYINIPVAATKFAAIAHSLLGTQESGYEHGAWAATTALEILAGKNPGAIPIARSQQGKLYINMEMANKLEFKLPVELIDRAALITSKATRVLYIAPADFSCNFYSDIEKGLLSALKLEKITNTIFDNTQSEVEFRSYIPSASAVQRDNPDNNLADCLTAYSPNIIVTAADYQADKILQNYQSRHNVPVIICGLDICLKLPDLHLKQDPKTEKYPNTIISLAARYAAGSKLGYIGKDSALSRDILTLLKTKPAPDFTSGSLTRSWSEFQDEFKTMQQSSDIIILLELCFDEIHTEAIYDFFLNHTSVPTISFDLSNRLYSLFGYGEFGFNKGWRAGQQILELIRNKHNNGESIIHIRDSKLYINQAIAKHLGVTIEPKILQQAEIIQ